MLFPSPVVGMGSQIGLVGRAGLRHRGAAERGRLEFVAR